MKTTMKKSVARIITLVMVLAMMMSFAVPAMAAEGTKVNMSTGFDDVANGVFKFILTLEGDQVGVGSAFLINEDHIVTAAHCVTPFSELIMDYLGLTGNVKEEFNKEIGYEVALRRDVTIKAELVTYSEEMDFAILKLEQPIPTKKYLPLRDCTELKRGDLVWSVGFPAFFENQNIDNDYTSTGVTTKPGSVLMPVALTEYMTSDGYHFKGMSLITSVAISGGDSGGPMVDKDGNVVGISVAGEKTSEDACYNASSINQVMELCDDLGIEYTKAGAAAAPAETVAPVETVAPTVAPTEAPVIETVAPTVAPTEAPTVPAPAPAPQPEPEPEPGMDMTTILIIAAVAVVLVIVVIVVVMGKKKKPAPQPVYTGAGQTAGFQTNSFTQPMGAGETTVLGGDAGETTILGRSTNGGTLIRKRTNETITINSDRFVIGRERKTSNYCVSDNSSVSRSHVTLSVRGGTTFLMDMNAANGTFVNGVKVMPNQEVALKNGDRIKLSDEEFEFRA